MQPCRPWKKGFSTGICLWMTSLLLTACGVPDGDIVMSVEEGTEVAEPSIIQDLTDSSVDVAQNPTVVQNDDLQEADTKEMLTFERLQELIQEQVPLLEHYAEYQDVGSRTHGCEDNIYEHISYPVWDPVSGGDLFLDIDYQAEGNQIYAMRISRKNDSFNCVLYNENSGSPGYVSNVSSKLEHYREDVGELFHWIKEYVFPPDIYVMIRPWQFRTDMGIGDWMGQTYWWIGEEPGEEKESDGQPTEWKAALGIMRIPQEYLVFADGVLQEVRPIYDLEESTAEYESLEGCREQALIWKINARQGKQRENAAAEDFWYVCLGREDSPWGYIVVMNCRHFSREEATIFVQSIQFQETAWQ